MKGSLKYIPVVDCALREYRRHGLDSQVRYATVECYRCNVVSLRLSIKPSILSVIALRSITI